MWNLVKIEFNMKFGKKKMKNILEGSGKNFSWWYCRIFLYQKIFEITKRVEKWAYFYAMDGCLRNKAFVIYKYMYYIFFSLSCTTHNWLHSNIYIYIYIYICIFKKKKKHRNNKEKNSKKIKLTKILEINDFCKKKKKKRFYNLSFFFSFFFFFQIFYQHFCIVFFFFFFEKSNY